MQTIQHYLSRYLVALAVFSTAAHSHAAAPDLLSREMCKQPLPQVTRAFAGMLEPVRRPGHCIAGDFNGDGKPDILMVVKVLVDKVPATAGIKTVYPFYDQAGGKDRLQFLALHSTPGGGVPDWLQTDKLLLDGGSPIMVLRHPGVASDMARITPRSKEVKELQLPARAMRGEAVYLGTEAVSAILYWDGKTYRLHEDPAGP